VRERVRADAAGDARVHVAAERVERDAAPREDGRAVRDLRARGGEAREVVRVRPVDLRVVVEEYAVRDDEVGAEQPDRIEPLDRRPAMASRDLLASARLSRSNPAPQVSICDGPSMPETRPEGWRAAASTTSSASLSPRSPAASSQW